MPLKNMLDLESNQTATGSKTFHAPLMIGGTCSADPAVPLGMTTKQYVDGTANRLNGVMNPNFSVWNRGTTFSSLADATFTADRWRYGKSGAGVNRILKSTAAPSVFDTGMFLDTSLQMDCTTVDASIAAGDFYILSHRIEGYRWKQFAQRVITLSFWVIGFKTGVYCVSFRNNASGTPDRSYVAEYTYVQAGVWQRVTITLEASPSAGTWNYTTGSGLQISFVMAAGSTYHTTPAGWMTGDFLATANQVNGMDSTSNFLTFAGIRLEEGSSAGPIQHRPYHDDYVECERHCMMSFPEGVTPAQNAGVAGSHRFTSAIAGAVAFTGYISFRTRMRPGGSGTLYNPSAANAFIRNVTDGADFSASAIAEVSENGMTLTGTATAGTAVGEQLAVHYLVTSEP